MRLVFEGCEHGIRGEREERLWTYHGGGERSNDQGKEDGDGGELETEHGRDYGMQGGWDDGGGLSGIREESSRRERRRARCL